MITVSSIPALPQQSVRLYFSGHEQTVPNHQCGPGIWPHYLLHFILSGKGIFSSGAKVWHLSAGDAFLIIPGVVSSYASDCQQPWEYCWIGFDGLDAGDILASCGLHADCPVYRGAPDTKADPPAPNDRKSPFAASKDLQLPAALGECLLSLNDALTMQPGNSYLHLSLLYRFFSLLSPQAGNAGRSPSDSFSKAVDYIQHNYAYDIRIQDVARHADIDRTYLYKLFIRELNLSPRQYLIQYRLLMAKHLLSSTTLQISEIANSCGFADSASFCHHFRAQFSVTPTRYRKEPGGTPIQS